MTALTVRTATPTDLDFLQDQAERLVQSEYRWAHHLSPENDSICLIAEEDGNAVGHILITPGADTNAVMHNGNGKVSWWKLQSLAVEPGSEGQGLASKLLEAGRAMVPVSAPGLYGNIELDHHPDVVTWYRAKGFRAAANGILRDMTGPGTGWGIMGALPDNLYFYAEFSRLSRYARQAPSWADELKIAEKEVSMRFNSPDFTQDYAYRALGRVLLDSVSDRCLHMDEKFGPQSGYLYGWDKGLKLICHLCQEAHRKALSTNTGSDRSDFCDGCRRVAKDVRVKTAAVDLHIFAAGLCAECRRTADFASLTA